MAQRYSVGTKPGKSVSSAALTLGLLAPVLAAAGALVANRGITTPFGGFLLFAASIPLSLLAILLALFAFFRARGGRNRAAAFKAGGAMTFAVMMIAAVIGLAAPSASYPRINDITTDTDDPPVFVANVKLQPHPGMS